MEFPLSSVRAYLSSSERGGEGAINREQIIQSTLVSIDGGIS